MPALSIPSPPPKLPTPKFQVATVEVLSHDGSEVNSLLNSQIAGAPKDRDKVIFNIAGAFSSAEKNFVTLRLVINEKLGLSEPKALSDCHAQTEAYDDHQQRVVINFAKTGDNFVAENGPCIVAALPPKAAFMANFLLNSFQDVAIGLVQKGAVDGFKEEALKVFFRRVAVGEVAIHK